MPCRTGSSVQLGRDEPLLHVAYKPFTGRLHSPGEYLLYGCELPGGEWQRAQLKLVRWAR
jgi:hypothetical protein